MNCPKKVNPVGLLPLVLMEVNRCNGPSAPPSKASAWLLYSWSAAGNNRPKGDFISAGVSEIESITGIQPWCAMAKAFVGEKTIEPKRQAISSTSYRTLSPGRRVQFQNCLLLLPDFSVLLLNFW